VGKRCDSEKSVNDTELARLAREVDRTRAEYQDATGQERDQCWRLYQRAMSNYNTALEKANQPPLMRQH
jgi:hypothetical protein